MPLRLTLTQRADFHDTVWEYYRAHRRSMPWRERTDAYAVLVSELMLQQAQVARVIPKFEAFIEVFPSIADVAAAPLAEVLRLWNGLGYNRRAMFLHKTAQTVMAQGGELPQKLSELVKLPGIGPNTAGAIMNYAYNQPTVFVETNIRTVYLHHFFADTPGLVNDTVLRELVEQTMDREMPREWFWALMDYGSHLKATAGGRLNQSKHYKKQTPLAGSLREMRGRIIRALASDALSPEALARAVAADARFESALAALEGEGMIELRSGCWRLTGHGEAS